MLYNFSSLKSDVIRYLTRALYYKILNKRLKYTDTYLPFMAVNGLVAERHKINC